VWGTNHTRWTSPGRVFDWRLPRRAASAAVTGAAGCPRAPPRRRLGDHLHRPELARVAVGAARMGLDAGSGARDVWEEVCLAATQHDVGMADHDRRPLLDPGTGGPVGFSAMPLGVHLELWDAAPDRMLSHERPGGAPRLAPRHGLYARRDLARASAADAAAIRAALARWAAREARWATWAGARPEEVERAAPSCASGTRCRSRSAWTGRRGRARASHSGPAACCPRGRSARRPSSRSAARGGA
jgi:hypothetical protein